MTGRRAAALLVLVAFLAACGSAQQRVALQSPAAREDLVGRWYVEADGEPAGTVLVLGAGLELEHRCGALEGDWAASASGLFAGLISGGPMACFTGQPPASPQPDWLDRAVRAERRGGDRALTTASGAVVALLTPAPGPRPHVRLAGQAEPAPAPDGMTAATLEAVAGRWLPTAARVNPAEELVVSTDGSWKGSDGCNGIGGRFALGDGGELVAVGGPSTLVGCLMSGVPGRFPDARRLATDHAGLVLLDGAGKVLGRLHRP